MLKAYSGANRNGRLLESRTIEFKVVTVPSAPQNLRAHASEGQLTLDWTAPGSDGFNPVTGYQYRSMGADASFESWVDVGTHRNVSIDNVPDGTPMTLEVRAGNAVGWGDAASITTPVMPGQVVDLSVDRIGSQATLSWTVPARNGGSTTSSYQYRLRLSTGDFGDWRDAGADLTETVTDLDASQAYVIEVRAVNVAGSGPATQQSTSTVVEFTLWDPWFNASLGVLRTGSVIDYDLGGLGVYTILAEVVDDAQIDRVEFELSGAQTHSHTDHSAPWSLFGDARDAGGSMRPIGSKLDAGMHELTATAYGADEEVLGLLFVKFAVVSERPHEPRNLRAHWANDALTMSWDAPDNDASAVTTGYEYRLTPTDSTPSDAFADAGTDRSVTISGLTDGLAATFDVRGRNPRGSGDVKQVELPMAPSPVRDLVATPSGAQATLAWIAPRHNGGASVTNYEWRSQAGSAAFTEWADAGTDLAETVPGLIPDTEYVFEVRAKNSANHTSDASSTHMSSTPDPSLPADAIDSPVLAGFSLVRGGSGEILQALDNDAVIALDDFDTSSFAIRADIAPGQQVGSVYFSIFSPDYSAEFSSENWAPYSLYGDHGRDNLKGKKLRAGLHTLTATAYQERSGGGDVLDTLTVRFTVAAEMPDAPQNLSAHLESEEPLENEAVREDEDVREDDEVPVTKDSPPDVLCDSDECSDPQALPQQAQPDDSDDTDDTERRHLAADGQLPGRHHPHRSRRQRHRVRRASPVQRSRHHQLQSAARPGTASRQRHRQTIPPSRQAQGPLGHPHHPGLQHGRSADPARRHRLQRAAGRVHRSRHPAVQHPHTDRARPMTPTTHD